MRILANENLPGDAVAALRLHGHDVVWVRDDAPGSRDREILEWAHTDERILITFDKDFGEFGVPGQTPLVKWDYLVPHFGSIRGACRSGCCGSAGEPNRLSWALCRS